MNETEERLERIEKKLDTLLGLLKAGAAGASGGASVAVLRAAPSSGAAASGVANDDGGGFGGVDLDGPRGDPEVRFSPRRWSGADFKGRRYSECDPAFLDMLADALEWFAQRDDDSGAVDKNGNPKGKWSRLDASRARGWAARLRANANGGAAAPEPARAVGTDVRRPARAPASRAPEPAVVDDDIPF
ncbi:MAG: hypothetical protein HY909_31650 [Deltaproteobacteria bacterium]|nr:hypothetical protein [Deltaproteobacteria bacterium]